MSFGLALPFGSAQKDIVGSDVSEFPALKIFDRAGNLLTNDGCASVIHFDGGGFP